MSTVPVRSHGLCRYKILSTQPTLKCKQYLSSSSAAAVSKVRGGGTPVDTLQMLTKIIGSSKASIAQGACMTPLSWRCQGKTTGIGAGLQPTSAFTVTGAVPLVSSKCRETRKVSVTQVTLNESRQTRGQHHIEEEGHFCVKLCSVASLESN